MCRFLQAKLRNASAKKDSHFNIPIVIFSSFSYLSHMNEPKFDTTFFERYAMIALQTILGDKYAHLVNSDRPDLQDCERSLGVEVTRSMKENKTEAEMLVNELAGDNIFCIDEADLQKIKLYGYTYGLYYGQYMGELEKRYWSLALPLKRIIKSKVHKVADGFYGNFDQFELFIFTKDDMTRHDIQLAVYYMTELQDSNAIRYSKLHIAQTDKLYVCDLKTQIVDEFPISKEMCRNFYRSAVGEGEKNG